MEETLPIPDKPISSPKKEKQTIKPEDIHNFLAKKESEVGPISDRMRNYFIHVLEANSSKSFEDVWRTIYG